MHQWQVMQTSCAMLATCTVYEQRVCRTAWTFLAMPSMLLHHIQYLGPCLVVGITYPICLQSLPFFRTKPPFPLLLLPPSLSCIRLVTWVSPRL